MGIFFPSRETRLRCVVLLLFVYFQLRLQNVIGEPLSRWVDQSILVLSFQSFLELCFRDGEHGPICNHAPILSLARRVTTEVSYLPHFDHPSSNPYLDVHLVAIFVPRISGTRAGSTGYRKRIQFKHLKTQRGEGGEMGEHNTHPSKSIRTSSQLLVMCEAPQATGGKC